ncbi:MAG: copper amine oxidase N-terminal domain-containing protein [Clostridia bacterium]|nr:copper amine oxidase N-terminal domain-containing protein [Clostridia bacterium]
MKFNFKKVTATAALAAMMMTGAAFANETEVINAEPQLITPFVASVEVINDVEMLPLRSTAEHFGYKVDWYEESQSVSLTKGAHYITFAINTDAYSFSRMAPQALGAAPVLFNDCTTYVPKTFFTDLIGLDYSEHADGLELALPNIVSVIEITEEGILVADEVYGEVLVLIGEDTKITANGEEASAQAIASEMLLNVKYSEQMTRSIPPQTTAISIELLNLPVENEDIVEEEKAIGSAKINSVEDGAIVVTDEVRGEVIVFVTEETKITKDGEEVSANELKADMEITIEYAAHMTMSIPPQTNAVSIEIVK